MQVSVSKNTLKVILMASIAFILLYFVPILTEHKRTEHFDTTNGKLISINRTIDYGTSSGESYHTKITYEAHYAYIVNGTEYKCSYRTFAFMKKFVKDDKTIIYNPDNPRDVYDEFKINTSIIGIIIGFVFMLFTIACMITKQKEDSEYDNN